MVDSIIDETGVLGVNSSDSTNDSIRTVDAVSDFVMETHPNHENALSDGPNMIWIHKMVDMLESLQDMVNITKQNGFLEDELT